MASMISNPEFDAQSKVSSIYAVLLVGSILSFSTVFLRLVTRLFIIRQAGIDDWTIVIAEVSSFRNRDAWLLI